MNKILLVEDDDLLGMVLNDQLEMYGYTVNLLCSAKKTIDYLKEEQYDLVILDKLLKGVDGTKICSEIRTTEGISEIPIVMMSGLDGAKKLCMDAGANGFIAKPFEVETLLKNIEASLAST